MAAVFAGEPTIIEGREDTNSSVPSIAETPNSKRWIDIDKVFNSSGLAASARKLGNGTSTAQSTGESEDLPKLKAKEGRRCSFSGPFAQFRCNKKKKNKQMCRCSPSYMRTLTYNCFFNHWQCTCHRPIVSELGGASSS